MGMESVLHVLKQTKIDLAFDDVSSLLTPLSVWWPVGQLASLLLAWFFFIEASPPTKGGGGDGQI